jgi:hypothetical protein
MLQKGYNRKCLFGNNITGRESQGACRQDELVGDKAPVVKYLSLSQSDSKREQKSWSGLERRELGRVLEMAIEDDWEEIARKKLDCAKKTSQWFEVIVPMLRSVATKRIVMTTESTLRTFSMELIYGVKINKSVTLVCSFWQ